MNHQVRSLILTHDSIVHTQRHELYGKVLEVFHPNPGQPLHQWFFFLEYNLTYNFERDPT